MRVTRSRRYDTSDDGIIVLADAYATRLISLPHFTAFLENIEF